MIENFNLNAIRKEMEDVASLGKMQETWAGSITVLSIEQKRNLIEIITKVSENAIEMLETLILQHEEAVQAELEEAIEDEN